MKKILEFYKKLFTISRWLVKIKLKSGRVITRWFIDESQADKLVDWILTHEEESPIKNIKADDCMIRLNRDEVETVSMKGYSSFQTKFIVPTISFLKQESSINITFKNAIAIFLICVITNFIISYNSGVFLFQEIKNFNYFNQEVLKPAYNFYIFLMILVFISIICAGLIKLKKAINNYYSDLLIYSRRSIFESLLLIFSLPLIIKLTLKVIYNIYFSFQ